LLYPSDDLFLDRKPPAEISSHARLSLTPPLGAPEHPLPPRTLCALYLHLLLRQQVDPPYPVPGVE
jgi:hypothetical protein